MASKASLAELGRQFALSTSELEFLRCAGVRTADAAHNLLVASLSCPDDQIPAMTGDRRRMVVEALKPLLSEYYRRALVQGAQRLQGAAAPSATALAQASTQKPSGSPLAKLQEMQEIDLVKGRHNSWPVLHDQGSRQACVPFAVAACLELSLAGEGTTFVPLSPQFLYWHIRTHDWVPPPPLPPGWDKGATKLGQAQKILAAKGFCRWITCPYDTDLPPGASLQGPEPSAAAEAEGAANLVTQGTYRDQHEPGIARKVYDELALGRPVAIAVPVFSPVVGSSVTNWSSGVTSGEVLDPYPNGVFAGGHAVCVVGFQPDASEPGGGWFIFRNSVGLNWASGISPSVEPPHVPARGYGAISATYVEGHCWEYLSPILA